MNTNISPSLISFRALRQLIGILGIALPFVCWGVNTFVNELNLLNNPLLIDAHQHTPYDPAGNLKSSISHFYYTAAGPLFTGILITVGIFLLCYQGYPKNPEQDRLPWLTDRLLASCGGIFLLGVVVFPTGSDEVITDNIHIFVSSTIAGYIHLGFAGMFFVAMAVMAIVNFRRNPGNKLIRNREGILYLVCGWGMLVCLLVLLVAMIGKWEDKGWVPHYFVFAMETVMLVLFGTAWLAKGKAPRAMNPAVYTELEKSLIASLDAYALEAEEQKFTKDSVWTKQLKEKLARLGEDNYNFNICTSGFPDQFDPEWLFDLVWYKEEGDPPVRRLIDVPLVVECEWNKVFKNIKYDFEKLLVANARHRLFVCFLHENNQPAFLDYCYNAVAKFQLTRPGDRFLIAILDYDTNRFVYKLMVKEGDI